MSLWQLYKNQKIIILKREKGMRTQNLSTKVYNIGHNYKMVRPEKNKCLLFFEDGDDKLLASIEGCQNIFNRVILPPYKQSLNQDEKRYLLSFIRQNNFFITAEMAADLQISVIKYAGGEEEYLSENQLVNKIAEGIDFAKIYVGKLKVHTLKIPSEAKGTYYNFYNAEIKKLIVAENCDLNIDFRDNNVVETIVMGDNFAGTINMSRTVVENISLADNCRCNLTVSDAKKCFNLRLGDFYHGNLIINNSCLADMKIGDFSYADIILNNDVVKKEMALGDYFRGNLHITNQNANILEIGNNCKGLIKIENPNHNMSIRKIIVGDDFAGDMIIDDDQNIRILEFGARAVGNFSVFACKRLSLIKAGADNMLNIESKCFIKDIKSFENIRYYVFDNDEKTNTCMPFYKKVYYTIRKMVHNLFI